MKRMSAAALNMVSFCKGRNTDVVRLTVLCSSPSLTWNVCSKMVYMILPMPNEGSITLGTTSSTVDDRDMIKPLAPVSFPSRFSRVKLTMQSLLESLHADHVLCEFERFAFCLDSELSEEHKCEKLTLSHKCT